MSALVKVALGLFIVAQVAIVAAVGWEALWLAALGLAAAVVVGVGARPARRGDQGTPDEARCHGVRAWGGS